MFAIRAACEMNRSVHKTAAEATKDSLLARRARFHAPSLVASARSSPWLPALPHLSSPAAGAGSYRPRATSHLQGLYWKPDSESLITYDAIRDEALARGRVASTQMATSSKI
eukprot:1773112-Pleurochrysis_carterae.AAC.2